MSSDYQSETPPIPKRPLTVYNIFSILERQYILQVIKKKHPVIDRKEGPPDQTLDPYYVDRPPKYRDIILPLNWYIVGSNRKPRSRHKNHGIISFRDLSNMITEAWSIVTPEVKAYCKMIAGNELAKYREDQKAFKERYGEAAYEEQARKRKKRKSVDGYSSGQKKRYDAANSAHLEDDGLKQNGEAAAVERKLAVQEVERKQLHENRSRSIESSNIEGLTGVSTWGAQDHTSFAQRIRSLEEKEERLAQARALRIQELQTRRLQCPNNTNGDPRLTQEDHLAGIFHQENHTLAPMLYLNESRATLNQELMMLQQQVHQEHMRGSFEDLNGAILNRELMLLQQLQAHQRRMRGAREEFNRGILNRELAMLQQQTNQERMIPPNAQTVTADTTFIQSMNPNQIPNHQQAHQGQLIQPSNPVGVSRQVIDEQLIRMRMAELATRYDTLIQMRIRAQATATDASVFQSRSHDQQQAHHESMNQQPTASNNDLSGEVHSKK